MKDWLGTRLRPFLKNRPDYISRTVLLLVFWTVVYYLTAWLSLLFFSFKNTNATPIWPPSGIALAMIWIFGYRIWPAVFLGAFLANTTTFFANSFGPTWLIITISVVIGLGNSLEAIAGRFLLKKYIRNSNPFHTVQNVVKFFLVVLGVCLLSASIGSLAVGLSHHVPGGLVKTMWLTWWLGDVAGMLTVAPLFIAFYKYKEIQWSMRQFLEWLCLLVLLAVINIGIFSQVFFIGNMTLPCAYLLLPMLVWSAFRFGVLGASIAILMTFGIAIAGTIHGFGPFAGGSLNLSLLSLLAFVGIIAVTGLILAAALKSRQRVDEELRENEKRFRNLVENSSDMIMLIDQKGKILYATFSTSRILGYEIQEYVGRNIFDFIHPEDIESIAKLFGQVVATPHEVIGGSCRYLHKDGSWLWLEGTGNNLLDDSAIGAIVVNARDITERKKAEERFRCVVEASPNALLMIDKQGKINLVNMQVEKLFGYSRNELIGQDIEMLLPARFRAKHPEYRGNFFGAPQARPMGSGRDLFGLHKDGREIPIEIGLNPLDTEEGVMVLASIIDITERKKHELALQESELRFRSMANTAPVMIWMSGRDAICNFFNKSWLVFTGQTLEDELGDGWIQGVHSEDKERCLQIRLESFRKKERFTMDYRLRRWDGEYRWILDSGVPRFTADGQFAGYIGSCMDITERKLAEEVLRKDAENLKQSVEEKSNELVKTKKELKKANRLADIGTLAATVAHELRNPLGVIQMAAFNLKRKHKDLSEDKHLGNIEKKVWEGSQIINNLLTYSNMKVPSYEKVPILKILGECVATIQHRFPGAPISIEPHYAVDEGFCIDADPLQLTEVFNNIVLNAYQAMTGVQGIIKLDVMKENSQSVKILISDSGVGMDPEDLEKVFTLFFTKKAKGTGLGLAICNELVNLHNGKIEITSKKGTGTTVSITLPIQRENNHG